MRCLCTLRALSVHSPCTFRALSVHSPLLKSRFSDAYYYLNLYVFIVDFWNSNVVLWSNDAPFDLARR